MRQNYHSILLVSPTIDRDMQPIYGVHMTFTVIDQTSPHDLGCLRILFPSNRLNAEVH